MRIQYCWRARCELPMLEESEWRYILDVHTACGQDPERTFTALSEEAQRRGGAPLTPPPETASPMDLKRWFYCAGYELFTGRPLGRPQFIYSLLVSSYGPPCRHCGKPLRTDQARFCAECGVPVAGADGPREAHV